MSRYPDEEKRKRILQVSFDSFGDLGYKRTTIKTIADRAGIAPGTIYTYFKDKDELFLSTINEIWDQLVREADRLVAARDLPYEDRLGNLFSYSEKLFRKSHSLLLGMFSLSTRRKMLQDNLERYCAHAWPLFREGREMGYNSLSEQDDYGVYQLRILFAGGMMELALVDSKNLEAAINRVREAFRKEFLRK